MQHDAQAPAATAPGCARPRWCRYQGTVPTAAAIVVITIVAALAAGCAAARTSIIGSITVNNVAGIHQSAGGKCSGTQGYRDFAPGAPVVVKNELGKTIASGSLHQGQLVNDPTQECLLTFAISNVPKATWYTVEVAHRVEATHPASRPIFHLLVSRAPHLLVEGDRPPGSPGPGK